jgi:hypothetical protein
VNLLIMSFAPASFDFSLLGQNIPVSTLFSRGTQQRSLFRQYATSRNVAGSIPDEFIGIFN